MKDLHELQFPDNLLYSKEHEWVLQEGEDVKIGISDYAQDRLGDIVFVDLPEPGTIFDEGESFGTVESVKSVSELYMPVSGKVLMVNSALEDEPDLVNKSPYSDGWMLIVKPESRDAANRLNDASGYLELLKGLS